MDVRSPARATAKTFRGIARGLDHLGASQLALMQEPRKDMGADEDEAFYAREYLHFLRPLLLRRPRVVLDLGCAQGRLTLPVAAELPEARVTGVDVSGAAVARGRERLAAAGLRNVELVCADAHAFLAAAPPASVDLAIFTEVDFFQPRGGLLDAIPRVLAPGGTLFASFRSQWTNLLHSVRQRDLRSARLVRDRRDAELWDSANRFEWRTGDDVRADLARVGLRLEGMYAIGLLSGREFDPLDAIARPAALDERTQEELLELELSLAERYVDCGRYILAVAVRP